MGKTSGSRKAKVFKNNKKLEEILEVEAISADMEFVEEYAMGKGPRKKIRGGVIDDKFDDKIDDEIIIQEKVKTAKVVEDVIKDVVQDDVEMFHQETISKAQDEQKQAESNRTHVPLSPKSTLLAFRREAPAEEDLPMQSSTIVPENQPSEKVYEPRVALAENVQASSVTPLQDADSSGVLASLPRPIARDTIDYYKKSVTSLTKENESLKALLSQVQDFLKQSQLGFKEYKDVHEKKVSGRDL